MFYCFSAKMLYIQVTANLYNVFLIACYISYDSWIHQELVRMPLPGLISQPCCVCLMAGTNFSVVSLRFARGVALVFVVIYIVERFDCHLCTSTTELVKKVWWWKYSPYDVLQSLWSYINTLMMNKGTDILFWRGHVVFIVHKFYWKKLHKWHL